MLGSSCAFLPLPAVLWQHTQHTRVLSVSPGRGYPFAHALHLFRDCACHTQCNDSSVSVSSGPQLSRPCPRTLQDECRRPNLLRARAVPPARARARPHTAPSRAGAGPGGPGRLLATVRLDCCARAGGTGGECRGAADIGTGTLAASGCFCLRQTVCLGQTYPPPPPLQVCDMNSFAPGTPGGGGVGVSLQVHHRQQGRMALGWLPCINNLGQPAGSHPKSCVCIPPASPAAACC